MAYYLIATCAVFLLSFWAYLKEPRRYADLMGVSVLLTLVFAISNLVVVLYGFPEALLAFPILDLTFAVMIYRAWLKNKEKWKVVMVGALVSQLALHTSTIAVWKTDQLSALGLWYYLNALNTLFIVQLGALGWVGGGHALRRLGAWLSDRGSNLAVSDGRQ